MRRKFLGFAVAATLLAQSLASGSDARATSPVYRIDPARSVVQFTVTKLGYSDVVGRFTESSGEIRWYAPEPEAGFVRWRVKVASVHSDADNRDRTLQNPEYFDAARHPELMYESTRVRAAGPGLLEVTGQLTMRGVTREQTVMVRHGGTAARPIFETDFEVDRYDFGIVGGRVMSRLIGRTVRVHLRLVTMEHTS